MNEPDSDIMQLYRELLDQMGEHPDLLYEDKIAVERLSSKIDEGVWTEDDIREFRDLCRKRRLESRR